MNHPNPGPRLDLCRSKYGRHVASSILENGAPQHQRRIASMLKGNLMAMATDRWAAYVIEDVLEYGHSQDKDEILKQLMEKDNIIALAKNEFGLFVVLNLLVKHDEVDNGDDFNVMDHGERQAVAQN